MLILSPLLNKRKTRLSMLEPTYFCIGNNANRFMAQTTINPYILISTIWSLYFYNIYVIT